MFTGIIETMGELTALVQDLGNLHLKIESSISNELQIDQSISHNGVCLTVTQVEEGAHYVTAIQETLNKTNFGGLQPGSLINLERCMRIGERLDGHIVQGHVDDCGIVQKVEADNGSWRIFISHKPEMGITVQKGSICVNGISLTVVDSEPGYFSVAIIPYTWEHTNLKELKPGNLVNLEFDILGKYIAQLMERNSQGFNIKK